MKPSHDPTDETAFQEEVIADMVGHGWLRGEGTAYNRKLALYPEDLLSYVKTTQPKQWAKFCKAYPKNTEQKFLESVAHHRDKAVDGADKSRRRAGTLGILRHEIRDRGARFKLCQFKPANALNEDTVAHYAANILRVVPELVYSPHISKDPDNSAKRHRIDLVLFVNGIAVITMELKSEFKQPVNNAINQYRHTRHPVDPVTKKAEPLLTFKSGALVHFAVSQAEVYMTTHLNKDKHGNDTTVFLPFNRGTEDGGAGNDIPEDNRKFATGYLWNEVLQRDNLLQILGRFMHLHIETKEAFGGKRSKVEKLIFPRYHQWDVVRKLIGATRKEGPGYKYLVQHSAGSGKSNSIAWTAHQLSALTEENGEKLFSSVIIVTDRNVLDAQLQDTISQFERQSGTVERINRREGSGSKSEKLASALEGAKPIIIVTIQTFPYVLRAIADSEQLKMQRYAIIADEAHSSQTGKTANQIKAMLATDQDEEEGNAAADHNLSSDEVIEAMTKNRAVSGNLSYFAFTATPKERTLQVFGRRPNPDGDREDPDNKPQPFHVYTMRQAIEEGFILDVLTNYTDYNTALKFGRKDEEQDALVDKGRARKKLAQWVRLHASNITKKAEIIVKHFREHVAHQLEGRAKAMVVTSGRKEAIRFMEGIRNYVTLHGYDNVLPMVAFSGDVIFSDDDPVPDEMKDTTYNERNMNPDLKGRDLPQAFDDAHNVMIVANKFQTGFDQPKLCAMYVDKALGGVECVQTLSRLNRIFPGKEAETTFVLDFINDPQSVLKEFRKYYKTAELLSESDPNKIYEIQMKLMDSGVLDWGEIGQFCEAFFSQISTQAVLENIAKHAETRWRDRYKRMREQMREAEQELAEAEAAGDEVWAANLTQTFTEAKRIKEELEGFKKDLGIYVRFYEFMSQIVDFAEADMERLCIFARFLRPRLHVEKVVEEPIDISNVRFDYYKVTKNRRHKLKLDTDQETPKLKPAQAAGSTRPKTKEEVLLSQLLESLSKIFPVDDAEAGEGVTENDVRDFAFSIRNKLMENKRIMQQFANNSLEQAMLGDFPEALEEALFDSSIARKKMNDILFSETGKMNLFQLVIATLLKDVC